MKHKDMLEEADHQPEYGMSFADLLSTIVGVFLILMIFFMAQNQDYTDKIIKRYEEEIENIKESQKKAAGIVSIRSEIVKDIKKVFEGSGMDISIESETGAIRFSDKILFGYNEYILSEEGKNYLNRFIPIYMDAIINDKTKEHISEIIIEGHTDDTGSYSYNLDLSQRRALAVTKYILSDYMPEFKSQKEIKGYLSSTGRSFSKIITKNGMTDRDASRRVEFKFRLKEEAIINEISDLLNKID